MRAVAIALVVGLVACGSDDEPCNDGPACDEGEVCHAEMGCVLRVQVEGCAALADGDACAFVGVEGRCEDGVCLPLICGDGIVSSPEHCDGAATDGTQCQDLGFYEGADVGCTADCRFDTTGCSGYCGDGIVNGPEECDGGGTCTSICTNG